MLLCIVLLERSKRVVVDYVGMLNWTSVVVRFYLVDYSSVDCDN